MNLALLHCPSFCPFDHWIGFLLNCGVPIDSETLPLQEDTVEATHDHHYSMHVRTHLETSFLLLRLGLGHAILPSYKQRTQASGSTCVPLASSCIDLIIGWVKHVNICSMLMLILENFNSTSIHIFSEPMWSTTCLIGQQLPQSRRMNDTPATTNLQLEVAYTISWRPKKISRERLQHIEDQDFNVSDFQRWEGNYWVHPEDFPSWLRSPTERTQTLETFINRMSVALQMSMPKSDS